MPTLMSCTPPRKSTETRIHTPSDAVSQPAAVATMITAAARPDSTAVTIPK
jgi:hypothetical protein